MQQETVNKKNDGLFKKITKPMTQQKDKTEKYIIINTTNQRTNQKL